MPKNSLESAAALWLCVAVVMVGCCLRTPVMLMAPLVNPASWDHQYANR